MLRHNCNTNVQASTMSSRSSEVQTPELRSPQTGGALFFIALK